MNQNTCKISASSINFNVVFGQISLSSKEVGSCVHSGVVIHHHLSWQVSLYVRGDCIQNNLQCGIYLTSSENTKASLSIKLLNHKDNKKSVNGGPLTVDMIAGKKMGWPYVTRSNLILDPLYGFQLNGSVIVNVTINIGGEIKMYDQKHSLMSNLKHLLFDESTCDCVIHVPRQSQTYKKRKYDTEILDIESSELKSTSLNDNSTCDLILNDFDTNKKLFQNDHSDEEGIMTISAHKVILQARSPVFNAMLSSSMLETTSNEIMISDFDHNIVKEFIRFLYLDTCEADVLDKYSKSLIAVAHKYEVMRLFEICENHLLHTLTNNTVIELLKIADMHDAKELKEKALKFFEVNARILSKKYRLCELLNFDLVHDVICTLSND